VKRWVTSDLHLFHENIRKFYPLSRPFSSVEEMNDVLVARWNTTIAPDDEVFAVGDVICWRKINTAIATDLLSRLNGKITLIRGNHDAADFVYLDAGWEQPVDHLMIDNILLIHRPCIPQNITEWDRFVENDPDLVVHGHVHTSGQNLPGHFNVCVDRHNLFPVPWDDILKVRENNVKSTN